MYNKEFIPLIPDVNGYDYGFMLDRIPDDLYNELLANANSIKSDFENSPTADFTEQLVAYMAHEYVYNPSDTFSTYVKSLAKYYEIKSKGYIRSNYSRPLSRAIEAESKYNPFSKNIKPEDIPNLYLSDIWFNFQRKNEYNPLHNHSGILSFVVWLDIPFTKQEEIDLAIKRNVSEEGSSSVGSFNFIYPALDGCMYLPIDADKSYNGVIALFPSKLQHLVYPFYSSDDYRITLAGNLYFKSNL